MDPVSALALVANIFQVVDFSFRLVSITYELHECGQLREHAELKEVAADLGSATATLQDVLAKRPGGDKNLRRLASRCTDISNELSALLTSVNARKTKFLSRSLQKTVRIMWNKEKIMETSGRLQSIRNELNFHVIVTLKGDIGDMEALAKSQGILLDLLNDQAQDILRGIMSHARDSEAMTSMLANKLDRLVTLESTCHEELMGTLTSLVERQSLLMLETSDRLPEKSHSQPHPAERILHWLRFSSMTDRREAIHPTHRATFEWIFQHRERSPDQSHRAMQIHPDHTLDKTAESKEVDHFERLKYHLWFTSSSRTVKYETRFVDWLETSQGVFWISGKAGSGKSTLMKFIADDRRTLESLRTWSGEKTLLVASFYFWKNGTELQRSQRGLLQALLHGILSKRHELASIAFPGFVSLVHEPTLSELQQAFNRLVEGPGLSFRLCLFVNGLDEFEGTSIAQSDLANYFDSLVSNPDIKAIISSRPFVQFEAAFWSSAKLALHDLTADDISQFVIDRLRSHPRMLVMIQKSLNGVYGLVTQIIRVASGVFLWVTLVVKALLDGLENHDSIGELRARLDELLPDLTDLYAHMLSQVPERYRSTSFRLIQLARQFSISLLSMYGMGHVGLLRLSFAFEDDPEYAFRFPIRGLEEAEAQARCDRIRVQVKSRCFGLVEIIKPSHSSDLYWQTSTGLDRLWSADEGYVRLAHRTVSDFLDDSETWRNLSYANPSFNPWSSLLRALIVQLKTRSFSSPALESDFLSTTLPLCFQVAAEYKTRTGQTFCRELEEVERVAWFRCKLEHGTLIPYSLHYVIDKEHNIREYSLWRADCLAIAIQTGNERFVIPVLQTAEKSRLLYVVFNQPNIGEIVQRANSRHVVRMAETLLHSGSDPNENWASVTPWHAALRLVLTVFWPFDFQLSKLQLRLLLPCVAFLQVFLDHHADVQATIRVSWKKNLSPKLVVASNRTPEKEIRSFSVAGIIHALQDRAKLMRSDDSRLDAEGMLSLFIEQTALLAQTFASLVPGVILNDGGSSAYLLD